jgi:hypothetical protein
MNKGKNAEKDVIKKKLLRSRDGMTGLLGLVFLVAYGT